MLWRDFWHKNCSLYIEPQRSDETRQLMLGGMGSGVGWEVMDKLKTGKYLLKQIHFFIFIFLYFIFSIFQTLFLLFFFPEIAKGRIYLFIFSFIFGLCPLPHFPLVSFFSYHTSYYFDTLSFCSADLLWLCWAYLGKQDNLLISNSLI